MANQSLPPESQKSSTPELDNLPLGHVRVGGVVGTHGIDGRLRVEPETDSPERFALGSKLVISDTPYTVAYVTKAAGGHVLIVTFQELSTREQAVVLVNEGIFGATDAVPPLPEDTYYHYQLLDMTVVDPAGAELGTLTEVISTGANDVYVVTAEGSELMIPALAYVVLEVDVANARMTIDVPEGIEPRSTIPKVKNKPVRRRAPRPKRPPSTPTASA